MSQSPPVPDSFPGVDNGSPGNPVVAMPPVTGPAAPFARLVAGYDAIRPTKKRRALRLDLRAEDNILKPRDRDQLVSDARNTRRNTQTMAWAVRTHVNLAATWSFQCGSGETDQDKRVEKFIKNWMKPLNCDYSRRFGFKRLLRIAEGLAFTEGDCLLYKIVDTTTIPGRFLPRIQLIEGDRIRTPFLDKDSAIIAPTLDRARLKNFVNGVEIDPDSQRALTYAICDRQPLGGRGYKLRALIDARYCLHPGYFNRYDQARGITDMAASLTTVRDLAEGRGAALGRMKVDQLFALLIERAVGSQLAGGGEDMGLDLESGAQILEMLNGDKAQFLNSAQPSQNFQTFDQAMTMDALKGADLPFSLYDEGHSTYSGGRLGQNLTDLAYVPTIEQFDESMVMPLILWAMILGIADGSLKLDDGVQLDDLALSIIHKTLGSIDPFKEESASSLKLKRYGTSRQRLAKADGVNWWEILNENQKELEALAKLAELQAKVDGTFVEAAAPGSNGSTPTSGLNPADDSDKSDQDEQRQKDGDADEE